MINVYLALQNLRFIFCVGYRYLVVGVYIRRKRDNGRHMLISKTLVSYCVSGIKRANVI